MSLGTLSKYELIEELGRGAFAVVYRARDKRLNREVALKVLNPAFTGDPHFVELFLREAQIAASLKHSNIVAIHDADEADGRLFIAIELLAGKDVCHHVEGGALPLPLAANVVEQIASALNFAHSQGIVHRDVKAANIILDEKGHATLTDFGLVRAVEGSSYGSSLSLSGGMVGTVEYISPEQVKGQKATAKSDLYALGITAYEIVSGRVPFKAETPIAVAVMHMNDAPPPLTNVPPEVAAVIMKAIAKNPDERQKDVNEFAAELRAALTLKVSPPIPKVEPPVVEKPEPITRPAPTLVPQLVSVMGIAGLVLVALFFSAIIFLPRFFATPTTEAPLPTLSSATKTQPPNNPTIQPPNTPTTQPPVTNSQPSPGIGSTRVADKDSMVQMYVPAGSFTMRSNRSGDEQPVHTVTLNAFWIDKTEVTNTMYTLCVKVGACSAPSQTKSSTRSIYYGNSQYNNYPVIYVSWNDANKYCGWAGRRLPTEAEWEKAARGADERIYPWGNQFDGIKVNSWSSDPRVGDTTEVGKYPNGASPYGALDMAGNVWEWVSSKYKAYPYNANDGREDLTEFDNRALRGGSWGNDDSEVSVSGRYWLGPSSFTFRFGFRCASSP